MKIPCKACHASGKIIGDGYMEHKCTVCNGDKTVEDKPIDPVVKQVETVDATVPIALDNNDTRALGDSIVQELADKSIVTQIRRRGRTPGAKNHKITKL